MEQIQEEEKKRGLKQIGKPIRRFDLEPNHLYEIYMDEFGLYGIVRNTSWSWWKTFNLKKQNFVQTRKFYLLFFELYLSPIYSSLSL